MLGSHKNYDEANVNTNSLKSNQTAQPLIKWTKLAEKIQKVQVIQVKTDIIENYSED